jgi:hypothetical protein
MGAGKTVKGGIELVETFLKELNKPAKAAVKAAPQDEALRLAQQRAALPPAQGGLGLPANNTPMQRAKALKYVDEGFHETEGANIEKGLSKFDVKRVGAAASDQQTPYAMFIKPHPAGIGVARKNPAQMPVLIKSNLTDENILRPFADRNELQQYLNEFPEIKESTKAVRDLDKKMADHIEELTKKADQLDAEGKTEEADKIYSLMGSDSPLMKDFDARTHELAAKAKDQITDLFKSQGIGTVGLTNDTGALGRKTITDMVLNPNENVRSRFAAFDPWRKDAATAAAFGVAAPDLMAKEQEKAMGGDVHMMGGGRPPKKTTLEEDLKSFKDPAIALADYLAGALRGTTTAATGFAGDMEELYRQFGKGAIANAVRQLIPTREGKATTLPTIEEMNAMLPPVVPTGAGRSARMADIGQFLGENNPAAPTAIAAVKPVARAVKAAAPIIKAGALDLAASRPAQEAIEQLGNITGAGPMYALPKELRAIKSAGKKEFKKQASDRATKDAEIAALLASLPARDKAANEAAGLYHQVGGGLKLAKPVSGMHSITVPDPAFNPPDINIITPEQLVKEEAALIPLVGDRAAGGRYLTHIGENELERPVRLTAGPRYMDANYNHLDPEQSAVWESGSGRVTALNNAAARAGESGRPVYGVYTAGSGKNTDFNVMGSNALLQQLPFSNITPEAAYEFDLAMREANKQFPAIKNWPGILSPEAMNLVLDKSNGILRTKLLGTMGKENFQSMGFPDVAATRKAIIEPELLDVPTNQAGYRLARMDPTGRIIENPNIPSDYPTAMAGKVAGRLDVPADYKDVWQSYFDARRLFSQPESGDYRSFSLAHPFQVADDEWLNRLMEKRLADELRIKEGEYAEGGEVHMSTAGAVGKALEKTTPVVDKAIKDIAEGLRGYIDPIATKISEWNWRPMSDVRQDVPDTEIPEYIQKGYGDFMAEQAKRAAAGDLNARDLIKAYTITRSSVNRGGLPYNTATKTGMQLPRTQGLVRPEGAFAEWLGSPAGQRYLDQAEKGTFTESDLSDMVSRFAPFGMPAVLADDMRYAARSLSPKGATISADVMASPDVYREVSQQLKGIGPAKSGFMASLLGRGDYPTFDARQIRLHTGQGGRDAAKYMTRGKGVGGEEAVARLADRQRAMNMSLDPSLDPFYQHLVHHTVWDRLGNEQTTHSDLVKAMRGYAEGGDVKADFFVDPSSYAQAKSKEMYPKKKSEWTERDAARHMLAAGMMAQKFGPTAAKMAGLAHEHFNAPVKTLGYVLGLNKMPADYEQDLHNNALGIDLAKRAATQEELERSIKEMTSKSSKTQTAGVPFIGEPKNAARLSDY